MLWKDPRCTKPSRELSEHGVMWTFEMDQWRTAESDMLYATAEAAGYGSMISEQKSIEMSLLNLTN